MQPTSSPPSAPLPSPPAQTGCFPTSSRTAPVPSLTSSLLNRSPLSTDELFQRHLGNRSTVETDTLSLPLALAHVIWPTTCDKHNPRLHRQSKSASASHHPKQNHHSHHHGSSSCCSHSHDDDDLSFARAGFLKIGTAFEKCSHELRHFLLWDRDTCPWCVVINEDVHDDVTRKLKEFGFFEDANGKHQECLSRKSNPKSKCKSGIIVKPPPPPGSTCCAASSSASIATKALPAPASSRNSGTFLINKSNASAATAGTTPTKPAAPPTIPSRSAPKANANPVHKPASANTSASAKTCVASPSSREQQKRPEPAILPSLLADCRKFGTLADSNGEKRTHMTNRASLAEVMRCLNRAVLVFCGSHRYNLIYAELASLVALLNYAAGLYYFYADCMEEYMEMYLDVAAVGHLCNAIYRNRADCIETEEYRTSLSSSDLKAGYSQHRAHRRHIITTEFDSIADLTDLRDGVQLVLFTFIWINYTAFQGVDKAGASTLHTLIPLLQTIIVRVSRQTYHLRGALVVASAKRALDETPPPKGLDVEWDLVELSNSLQNLSGSDVAMFAPTVYSADAVRRKRRKGSKKKQRQRKKTVGWPESVVSVPYTVSLYTVGVCDIAYRYLNKAVSAQQSGKLSQEPEKEEVKVKKCSSSTCKCATDEDKQKAIVDELHQRTTLVERRQYDWKSLVMKNETSNVGMNKKKDKKKRQKEQKRKNEQEKQMGKKEQKKQKPLKSLYQDWAKKVIGAVDNDGVDDSEDEYESDVCIEDGVGGILMDRYYDIQTYNSRVYASRVTDKAVQRNTGVKANAATSTTATTSNGTFGKSVSKSNKPKPASLPWLSALTDSANADSRVATSDDDEDAGFLRSLLHAALTDPDTARVLADPTVTAKLPEWLLTGARASAFSASGADATNLATCKQASPASMTLPESFSDSSSPLTTPPDSRSASPSPHQRGSQAPSTSNSSPISCPSSTSEADDEIPPMPPGFKEYFELLHGDRLFFGETHPEWVHLARDPKAQTIKEAGFLESEEFLQIQWKYVIEARSRSSKSKEGDSDIEALGSGWSTFDIGAPSVSEGASQFASSTATASPDEAATIMLYDEETTMPPVPSGSKDIFREMMGHFPLQPSWAHLASNPSAKTLRDSGVLDNESVLEVIWKIIYQRTREGIAHKKEGAYGPFTTSEYVSLVTAAPREASASIGLSDATEYRPVPAKFKGLVQGLAGDEPLGSLDTQYLPKSYAAKVSNASTLNDSGFLESEEFLELLWHKWNDLKRKTLQEQGGPPPDPAEGIDFVELREELAQAARELWVAFGKARQNLISSFKLSPGQANFSSSAVSWTHATLSAFVSPAAEVQGPGETLSRSDGPKKQKPNIKVVDSGSVPPSPFKIPLTAIPGPAREYPPVPVRFKQLVENLVGDEPLPAMSWAFLPPSVARVATVSNPTTLKQSGLLEIEKFVTLLWTAYNKMKESGLAEEKAGSKNTFAGSGEDKIEAFRSQLLETVRVLWQAGSAISQGYTMLNVTEEGIYHTRP